MLINVKLPTIVGILTFMSRINFVLSSVEYEKSFITWGPGQSSECLLSGSSYSEVHSNIHSRHNRQTTFLGQNTLAG